VVAVPTVILIGFLGGLIAGVSPCILPILPLIFFGSSSTGSDGAATAPAAHRRRRPLAIVALAGKTSCPSKCAWADCRKRHRLSNGRVTDATCSL